MFAIARKFASTVLPGVIKPLRVLWNEMIGFVFIVFAVFGGSAAYRNFANTTDPDAFGRGMLGALFGVVMLAFGLQSFFRARRINRG